MMAEQTKRVAREPTREMLAAVTGPVVATNFAGPDDQNFLVNAWRLMHDAAPDADAGRVAALTRRIFHLEAALIDLHNAAVGSENSGKPVSEVDCETARQTIEGMDHQRIAELERRIERALEALDRITVSGAVKALSILRGEA